MKSIVKGQIVERVYRVGYNKEERDGKEYLLTKPILRYDKKITYKDICGFEGDFVYNRSCWGSKNTINISEDEEVIINTTRFRADLNEQHIFTDKVLEETETNKEEAEKELTEILKVWNKQEIEKDEKLLAYCNLHKLWIEDIDVDELKKVVYGENKPREIYVSSAKPSGIFDNYLYNTLPKTLDEMGIKFY